MKRKNVAFDRAFAAFVGGIPVAAFLNYVACIMRDEDIRLSLAFILIVALLAALIAYQSALRKRIDHLEARLEQLSGEISKKK